MRKNTNYIPVKCTSMPPSSFLFPEYMLGEAVSQTAKLLYMVLLNEAFDMKSDSRYISREYIVVRLSLAELAGMIGRCETTVKHAIHELSDTGYIWKQGFQGSISSFVVYIPPLFYKEKLY